jgi:putative ABC transport system permease protein
MTSLSRLIARWTHAFRHTDPASDIEQELQAFVDERTDQGVAAGLDPGEARRRAQIEVGGIAPMTQKLRDQHARSPVGHVLGDLWRDLRHAARQGYRAPAFSLVAVLTLGLGIGGAAAMFGLIRGVLLSPPPYADPDRLVLVSPARLDGAPYAQRPTTAQWLAWRASSPGVETALYRWRFDFLIRNEGTTSLGGMVVTPNYFRVMGIAPIRGRTFLDAEAATNGPPTAVIIGYELWQRTFEGDPDIVGRTLQIGRMPAPVPIVGVMPPGIRFLPDPANVSEPGYDVDAHVDVWLPALADEAQLTQREWNVVGRLAPNISAAVLNAEVAAVAARQRIANTTLQGMTATARPAMAVLNEDGRRLLVPLFGAVALVFFIACANVAGLLLARGLHRQRDYLVRAALGATWPRLFRQALTESVALALVGAVVGSGFAVVMVALFLAVGQHALPRADAVAVGWPVLAFCVVVAPLAAAIAGLLPAARAAFGHHSQGVQTTRTTASPTERRLIGGVATLQIVLTVGLLAGAALLVRTARNLADVRPGYDTEHVLTMTVTTMRQDAAWKAFHADALERVSRLPDVRRAAFAWGVPLTGNSWPARLEIVGSAGTGRLADELTVPLRAVTPDYFDAMGIQVAAGRAFREADDRSTPPVAIVNQAFVTTHFGPDAALGRSLRFAGNAGDPPMTIVGVVADTRTDALSQKATPEAYLSLWQQGAFSKHLIVRTSGDPMLLAASIRQAIREVDPAAAIEQVKTMGQLRQESIAPRTFAMHLLVGFSIVATLLSLVGLYGVLSLSVGARLKEMAVRKAIGAQRDAILSLVLGEGLRLIGAGVLLGLGCAVLMGRVFRALLFGVPPTDPLTLGAAALLFVMLGLLACALPAWRAARVNLMEVLRQE